MFKKTLQNLPFFRILYPEIRYVRKLTGGKSRTQYPFRFGPLLNQFITAHLQYKHKYLANQRSLKRTFGLLFTPLFWLIDFTSEHFTTFKSEFPNYFPGYVSLWIYLKPLSRSYVFGMMLNTP